MKAGKSPYAKKDTFWNKLRVEKGLTIREVAEMIGYNETPVGMWFSGQNMPTDASVVALCNLFDIDYTTGQLEFQHAHREWKAEHNMPVKCSAKKKNIKPTSTPSTTDDLLRPLYDSLSYDEFISIYNALVNKTSTVNLAELLYGKIDDYKTYNKIISEFQREPEPVAEKDKWDI